MVASPRSLGLYVVVAEIMLSTFSRSKLLTIVAMLSHLRTRYHYIFGEHPNPIIMSGRVVAGRSMMLIFRS